MLQKMNLNRRRFLKTAAATAVIGTTGLLGIPRQASAQEGRLVTLIDLTRCNGCTDRETPACVAACKEIKAGSFPEPVAPIPIPFPTRKVEDWSKKREVADRLTPYSLITVQKAELSAGGLRRTLYIPRRCMHCDNPACATLCPFAANHKFADGAVVIDPAVCFGGAKCKTVCPWEIPQRQSGVGIYLKVLPTLMGNGIMVKCDLCKDRLDAGKIPACIEACPQEAMRIGPRQEIDALAEELARGIGGHLYGKTENGGTSTLYVSPVPFAVLNAAVEKGPGRPGFEPVQRRMEETDRLGKAVLAAPLIGVAAGVAGLFTSLARRKDRTTREE